MALILDNPDKISLTEIPDDGSDFKYSLENHELKKNVSDLDILKVKCKFNIMPAGDLYSLSGSIDFKASLACSKCAFGFDKEFHEKVSEVFYVKENELTKADKRKKSGSSLENDIFCNELDTPYLIASDWIREVIVSALPYSVTAKENCDSTCENYKKAVAEGQFVPEAAVKSVNSPFSKLKELKKDS